MNNTQLHHVGSRTTSRLLSLAAQSFDRSTVQHVTGGLPAGSLYLVKAGLVVGGTPCSVPLFRPAMERAALMFGHDVLVARHGMHPELLDPVVWDVVIWSGDHIVAINDLILYADPGGDYWLVPSRNGPHIRMASNGLHLEAEPPFMTWDQRCAGVCLAAKRIVGATRCAEER